MHFKRFTTVFGEKSDMIENLKKTLDKRLLMCYNILRCKTKNKNAGMAELADALASGASDRKVVEVQVLLPAL